MCDGFTVPSLFGFCFALLLSPHILFPYKYPSVNVKVLHFFYCNMDTKKKRLTCLSVSHPICQRVKKRIDKFLYIYKIHILLLRHDTHMRCEMD